MPKPAYAREFMFIVIDALIPRCRDDIPQRYVNVTGGQADGCRACDHQWLGDFMPSNKPEFLEELAGNRFSRVFPWLDVTSRREPELRTLVIDEKNVLPVNHCKVCDQVFWRGCRFRSTKQRRARINPCERVNL